MADGVRDTTGEIWYHSCWRIKSVNLTRLYRVSPITFSDHIIPITVYFHWSGKHRQGDIRAFNAPKRDDRCRTKYTTIRFLS